MWTSKILIMVYILAQDKEEPSWITTKVKLLKGRRKIIYYSANKRDPSVDSAFESDYTRLFRPPVPIDLDYIDSHKFKSTFHEPNYMQDHKPKSFFDKIVITPKRNVIRYNIPDIKLEDIDLKSDFFNPDILMSDIGDSKIRESHVEIGKRSLLLPVLKNYKCRSNTFTKCSDHSMMYYNL